MKVHVPDKKGQKIKDALSEIYILKKSLENSREQDGYNVDRHLQVLEKIKKLLKEALK